MWTYKVSTGELSRNGKVVGKGYSGHEECLNQPDMECVADRGPIPRGYWRIGPPFLSHDGRGPYCLPLGPLVVELYDRCGFLMHGDNPSRNESASHGCIVMPHEVRVTVWTSGDRDLEVVP